MADLIEAEVEQDEPPIEGAWLVGLALLAAMAIITLGLVGFGLLFA